jgi:hypothetical protein
LCREPLTPLCVRGKLLLTVQKKENTTYADQASDTCKEVCKEYILLRPYFRRIKIWLIQWERGGREGGKDRGRKGGKDRERERFLTQRKVSNSDLQHNFSTCWKSPHD